MKLLATTKQEWDAIRSRGIGGSDAGAVCGVSHWATPLDVYNRKLGIVDDKISGDRIYWGNVLEDIVAQEYAKRTGTKVRRRNHTFVHDDHDFMLANIDRWVCGQNKILEVKTADRFVADQWGEEGTDEVPENYLLQVAHYMAVLDVPSADIAVLIGGNDFRIYHIKRNPQLEKNLIEIERDFWRNHVEKQVPPPPKNLHDIDTLFGNDNGLTVDAGADEYSAAEELLHINTEIKQLEQRKDELIFALKNAMGDNAVLRYNGQPIATWKNAKPRTSFDSKRLKEEHPALYDKYIKVGNASRRFTLKLKGE